MAREAATQSFDQAAEALAEDWDVEWDGKQVQRWAQELGREALRRQEAELVEMREGRPPSGPANDPQLLVVEMDGGRVQGREKDPDSGSRWREDKVATVVSYLPGDGKNREPVPLTSTSVATMRDSKAFGELLRLECEKRGVRQAKRVVVIGDGAAWIDSIHQEHLGRHVRIVDYYHACEHLHEAAKAALPDQEAARERLAEKMTSLLWRGRVNDVIGVLEGLARQAGPPQESDGADHPRRVLHQNVGYFRKHKDHMQYAAYHRRGWPIGSGAVESGVKQFNKRVKGTEQFWHIHGVEPILALRGLRLSQDGRWTRFWRPDHKNDKHAA